LSWAFGTKRKTDSVFRWLAQESLPLVVGSAFLWLLATLLSNALSADGWLALVSGRLIAHSGLPHHDTLAVVTSGREWVDQQWLGQLAEYALVEAGGIRLLLSANLVLVALAFFAGVAYARRRGGTPAAVALVALLALLPFLAAGMNVRTQSLVYLPFAGLVALLVRRSDLGTFGAACVLAVCILLANVHGSVLLAAIVIAARGGVGVVGSRSRLSNWMLLLGPWVCVLGSPYHVHLVVYYAETAFNPSFSAYLGQWAPTQLSPISAPLLVLVFATVWMLGRSSSVYSRYEQFLLVLAIVLSLVAIRNWVFGSLLLLMLTPRGFDHALRRRRAAGSPAFGALIAGAAVIAAIGATVSALSAPESDLTQDYPVSAARAAVRAASSPGRGTVYAGIPFADWLLWTEPSLVGRVAFDVRYELLESSEVKRLVLFDAGSGLDNPLQGSRVFVLDPQVEKHAVSGLNGDVRIVYDTDRAVVAVRRGSG
jgi:hypothetical protein